MTVASKKAVDWTESSLLAGRTECGQRSIGELI